MDPRVSAAELGMGPSGASAGRAPRHATVASARAQLPARLRRPRRVTGPDRWPSDYFAARERFVALARAAGARLERRPVRAVGPGGEALSVDVAALGAPEPERLVVLTSGVHGVEGFLGARVQHRALERLAHDGLPDRVGVALVHAVNPWGFAHLRRVDEDNVDVNRNFPDPSAPPPEPHPRYAELDAVINPRGAPRAGDEARFWLDAARLIARDRGIASLAGAIARGQNAFPRGLFFGGTAVGESCALLQDVLRGLAAGAGRVTHLDVHSGLGPSAAVTLIGNAGGGGGDGVDGGTGHGAGGGDPERRASRLAARYRRPVRLDDASDNAYDARGTLCRWYRRAMADRPWTYLCVEVGTVGPLGVLSALRRENRAHHWTAAGSAPYARTKRALLDVFAPPSRRWRERSVAGALEVFGRAVELPSDGDRDSA